EANGCYIFSQVMEKSMVIDEDGYNNSHYVRLQ
ncbi:unnamed protein product, partial [Rotaria magnacalcarata]